MTIEKKSMNSRKHGRLIMMLGKQKPMQKKRNLYLSKFKLQKKHSMMLLVLVLVVVVQLPSS